MKTNSLRAAGQFTDWQKLHKQGNPHRIFPLIRKKEIQTALLFNHTASPHSPRHSAAESTEHHDTALPNSARHKERKRKKNDIFFSTTEEGSLIPSEALLPLLKGARRTKHTVQKSTRPKISKGRSQKRTKRSIGYFTRRAREIFNEKNPGEYDDYVRQTDPENPEKRITRNSFARRVQRRGWTTEEEKAKIEPITQEAEQKFQDANPAICNGYTYGIDPENPSGEKITRRAYMLRTINEYWKQELPDHTSPTAPDVADH